MTELLNNYLYLIILYFPLGVIGIYRWSIWIIKKIIAKKYRPVSENGYRDTLSIVVPVYNEDPNIFERTLVVNLENERNNCNAYSFSFERGAMTLSYEIPLKEKELQEETVF